jgi:hypothetical protein
VSRRHTLAAAALALVAAAAPAAAQGTPPAAAPASTAADEQAAMAVVTGLFDAMRARDTTTIRKSFAEGTTLMSVGVRAGQPAVTREPIDTWIKSVAGAPAGLLLDERLYNPRVHVSGGLATVWVEYDFYAGDRFSHCGVDAFILVRLADGWKVASLADTRQREGCPKR